MVYLRRAVTAFQFLTAALAFATAARAEIRDGGIDPSNLGKGEWIFYMSDATNRLGGNVSTVTNETSLMRFYKSQGIRYLIIKAATSDKLFNGSYSFPQFTARLVDIAHAEGILMFGYNRSWGSNIVAEIGISDYVFEQGADGFVWDAEAEWESGNSWIGNEGPAKAWELCSTVRSNWPTKFLAHAPFPIISLHSSFPYKEFGYWCDAVMPQIYHFSSANIKRSTSAGINWTDANWASWQNSLYALPSTNINGMTVYWTNSIKPLAPVHDVYGPLAPTSPRPATPLPNKDVTEFMDYLSADPHSVTASGYKGVNFFRTDLHGTVQWANIKAGTSGDFPGIINNIVIDDHHATKAGAWTAVRTFSNGQFFGGTTDTNSFGTNYLTKTSGSGSAHAQFTPNIRTAGDYNVYQWHPELTNASASVPFIINFNGGSTLVYADQRTNSGSWSLLGKFNFMTGTAGYIRMTDAIPENDKVAACDGLKLVFVAPSSVPATPSDLLSTAVSTSQINLVWTDNATNETSYIVARAMTAGGPYTDIAMMGANATGYANTGLAVGTTYYYTVRATNFLGASATSAVASGTTWDVLDENGDADMDGASNGAELAAGTDPRNSASTFRITETRREGNNLRLSWTTVGNKRYAVQATPGGSPNVTGFSDISPVIAMPTGGEGVTNFLHLGAIPNAARFYRIRLIVPVVFSDDFESASLSYWSNAGAATALTLSIATNHTTNGGYSAAVTNSLNRMYHNLGLELDGHAKVTFWIYDNSGPQNRVYGEVRAYSGGGYTNGALQQLFAAGRYGVGFGTGTGTLAGEAVNTTRYQGRVVFGANTGWLNLNATRSIGWHKFEIERLTDGSTINFYVDGIADRTIPGATSALWDSVTIGSVGSGPLVIGDGWFDDVKVEYLDP